MTPAEALVVEAQRFLKVREDPAGSNRGVEVDYWIRECGLDPTGGFAWCAAFVGQMGRQALGRWWPCPRTASVMQLVAWARERPTERWYTDPQVGDLFAIWHEDLARYAHVGIVATVAPGRIIHTVEGNANPAGGREGFGVFALDRPIAAKMMFVRWTSALPAAMAALP